jgi:hypothetical protein
MKRFLLPLTVTFAIALTISACAPAAVPTQDQSAVTLAAQTIQALMTQVVKQSTPFIPPTFTATVTSPATNTPNPMPTNTPIPQSTGSNQTPGKTLPTITRTLSGNCLSSFFVGIIGAKWDTDRNAWVLEQKINQPFTATFDVRNNGTCTWDPSFKLIYYQGDHMNGPNSVLIGSSVDPNDPKLNHVNVDVGPLTIFSLGYTTGYWAMKTSDGRVFGSSFLITVHTTN